MSKKERLQHELKTMGWLALYFGGWIAVLILLKQLILAEYEIAFHGFSMAVVGALILSKVVLILEHVPLGTWMRRQPAWMDVILRTALYGLGVVVMLLLEKGFEGRHEHGGFVASLKAISRHADLAHVWVNTICVTAALLLYNLMSVIRRHVGKGALLNMLLARLPSDTESPRLKPPVGK